MVEIYSVGFMENQSGDPNGEDKVDGTSLKPSLAFCWGDSSLFQCFSTVQTYSYTTSPSVIK